MKSGMWVISGLFGALLGALSFSVMDTMVVERRPASFLWAQQFFREDLSRYDLASMTLTVATLVLAAVAIFLGVFAIYTITSIKEDLDGRVEAKVTHAIESKLPEIDEQIAGMGVLVQKMLKPQDELEDNFDPDNKMER